MLIKLGQSCFEFDIFSIEKLYLSVKLTIFRLKLVRLSDNQCIFWFERFNFLFHNIDSSLFITVNCLQFCLILAKLFEVFLHDEFISFVSDQTFKYFFAPSLQKNKEFIFVLKVSRMSFFFFHNADHFFQWRNLVIK